MYIYSLQAISTIAMFSLGLVPRRRSKRSSQCMRDQRRTKGLGKGILGQFLLHWLAKGLTFSHQSFDIFQIFFLIMNHEVKTCNIDIIYL